MPSQTMHTNEAGFRGKDTLMLSPTGHVDTFCRENLPHESDWPELRFDLPELDYPGRLNCAVALLDSAVKRWGPSADA
jgi:2-aminobenzoate-CoA ligase